MAGSNGHFNMAFNPELSDKGIAELSHNSYNKTYICKIVAQQYSISPIHSINQL